MWKKFFSRKFLITLIPVIAGILSIYNIDDTTINIVTTVLMIVIPTLSYVITEGKIDEKAVGMVINNLDELLDLVIQRLKEEEKQGDQTEPEVTPEEDITEDAEKITQEVQGNGAEEGI